MKIRYYSHVGLPTGYGRAATELALALARHPDVDLELVRIPTRGPMPALGHNTQRELDIVALERQTEYRCHSGDLHLPLVDDAPDAVIVHTLPRDCNKLAVDEHLGDLCCPVVAYTTWEGITASPVVKDALRPFARVWVPSEAARRPLIDGNGTGALPPAKVAILPHAFDPARGFPPRRAELDDTYRFYYVGAWTPRKNPEGLLRAFMYAFRPEDQVELILRTSVTTEEYMTALARSALEQGEHPAISLIPQHMTDEQLRQLHADADCFVTASRGEAWDLGAFDAMLAGRHIITPQLGSLDFLGATSADILGPIDQRCAPAHAGVRAEPVRGPTGDVAGFQMVVTTPTDMTGRDLWYEPDLVELGNRMYDAWRQKKRHLHVKYDPKDRYSHAAVADAAVQHLTTLLAQGDPP